MLTSTGHRTHHANASADADAGSAASQRSSEYWSCCSVARITEHTCPADERDTSCLGTIDGLQASLLPFGHSNSHRHLACQASQKIPIAPRRTDYRRWRCSRRPACVPPVCRLADPNAFVIRSSGAFARSYILPATRTPFCRNAARYRTLMAFDDDSLLTLFHDLLSPIAPRFLQSLYVRVM